MATEPSLLISLDSVFKILYFEGDSEVFHHGARIWLPGVLPEILITFFQFRTNFFCISRRSLLLYLVLINNLCTTCPSLLPKLVELYLKYRSCLGFSYWIQHHPHFCRFIYIFLPIFRRYRAVNVKVADTYTPLSPASQALRHPRFEQSSIVGDRPSF